MSPSPEFWMATGSMAVSAGVLIHGALQQRAVARKDYVDELTTRIEDCERRHRRAEDERADCERERQRLERLTADLMIESRLAADRRLATERHQALEERPPSTGGAS